MFEHWKKKFKNKAKEDYIVLTLADVLGEDYDPYQSMSVHRGLTLSPVAAAHRILTTAIGALPVGLYRTNESSRERVIGHPTLPILTMQVENGMTPFSWKKIMMSDCYWYGEAFARPIYDGRGKIVELQHYDHSRVSRVTMSDNSTWYRMTERDGSSAVYAPDEIVKFLFDSADGEHGFGMLSMAKQTVNSDLAAQSYSGKFYTNGARPSGILETVESLSPEKKDILREEFMKRVGGKNAYKVAVLDSGVKYTQLGITQHEAQYLENRNFTVEEVARFTGIPLYKLQAGKQSYQSNEQQGIDFVVNTLQPIVVQWEQELSCKLLTRREQESGMYYRFNLAAHLRGDNASRAGFYQKMIGYGIYTIDECRALEELAPLPGGLGSVPLITKNMDSLKNVLTGNTVAGGETAPGMGQEEGMTV